MKYDKIQTEEWRRRGWIQTGIEHRNAPVLVHYDACGAGVFLDYGACGRHLGWLRRDGVAEPNLSGESGTPEELADLIRRAVSEAERRRSANVPAIQDVLAELLWPLPVTEGLARVVAALPGLIADVAPPRVLGALLRVREIHLRADRAAERWIGEPIRRHLAEVHGFT
jgi:hypothetical protein